MLTGLLPEGNGCYGNEGAWPGFQLPEGIETFPEVFARSGYATANFGKLHVPPNCEPWEVHEPEGGGMGDLQSLMPKPLPPNPLGAPYPAGLPYKPELVVENGTKWIGEQAGPYLARFSILQPHTPLFPRPPYDRMYDDLEFSDFPVERTRLSATEKLWSDTWKSRGYTREQMSQARVYYCGLVSWVDEQVGRILGFLRGRGELENTILLFSSDHGTSKGENGCGEKHIFAPYVHRVPLIVAWPGGGLPTDDRRGELAQNIDIPRTLFSLAGIDSPDQFQGRALLSESEPDAVFSTIGCGFPDSRAAPNGGLGVYYDGRGWPRRTCVRTREYRYERTTRIDGGPPNRDDRDAFFAVPEKDPFELWNRVDDPEYADVVSELDRRIGEAVNDSVEIPWDMVKREDRLPQSQGD